ncbi:MAG TPA: cytochrome c [Acidimicrobiales bacterium]|nr:cytochrome c [Acidimicrobiales bacterium]
MTEVPEHLLRRSKERRAALGLGGADTGGAPSAASEPAAEAPAEAAAPAVPADAAAPVPATPEPVEELTPYVEPAIPRRVPAWVYPVLAVLPFWAFVYFGAFGERGDTGPVDPMVLGEEVYRSAGCAGCHGANGQGQGNFPALAGGEVLKTFPDEADHVSWIETGSAPFKGQPYGDPNREGGQRVATTGGMPAFGGSLSPEEIEAVVLYEREGL